MAYESTTVPVERSQGEIRKLLSAHQAAQFAFGEETDLAGVRWAAVSFAHDGYAVRARVPHKPVDQRVVNARASKARTRTAAEIEHELGEQEARRIWRVMAWNLKARLVAVDENVETFAEAFLAHLIDPQTGQTVFDTLSDTGRIDLGRPLLALPSGGEPR
jgi:hypothetical protein